MGKARTRYITGLSAALAATLLVTLGIAGPAVADDFPTWEEVEAARGNEQATQQKIAEIEKLLEQLEADSAALGRTAQKRAEEYNAARAALDSAAARADRLKTAASEAAERARVSNQRAGQLIAQLARTGGGDLNMALVMAPDAEDLLGTLGTASKVAERAAEIYEQASVDRNRAESMTAQAEVAEAERAKLSTAAETALTEAQAASAAMDARLAEQQAASDQLYEQLASLKGTTADVESRYLEGLQQATPPPAPPTSPAGPSNPSTPAPNPNPAPPNTSAAAGAIAFAYAQIGKPYVFGGSGPYGWDCSGLTKAAYASVGVYIGAHLVSSQYYTMANAGRLVPIGQMQPGDLIYYADGGYAGSFYHVAMYVGGGMMVEAPREGVPVRVTGVRYYDALPYAGRPTG
ncbi:cell wall-associated NlpC family hydrolase [Microbacteriaceae bacterium SG_E_30_P1]|uniref:Cell wall-associated NlpC family hydrolase n=1 Tax=Antiquaquibacter oligotrophicus TaxID=2880260 RepID=A0ABT6KIQ9_9MICO|nr:C40 family peptidase [Antiquaquibacter oligotrophicus]MDH6179820.1 cell wall-associated NlpC family hydrolase [Antiquaquibacter oligotrophicus]UDF14417.1 NlpC/P60 family protein [Antiquaquibacter oligotrophicus]